MLRIKVTRSMILASLGKTSLTWRPGTDVEIGLNSPLTSAGAPGLGSNVSMCEAPPASQTRMQFLGGAEADRLDGSAASARSRNQSSSESPRKLRSPTLRASRRVGPWHGKGLRVLDMALTP